MDWRTGVEQVQMRQSSRWTDEGVGQGGLKGICTSLSISLSHIQITCLIAMRVCRVLGSAVGSMWIPMLKHPYNPKGAQTHLPCLSVSLRGAKKSTFSFAPYHRLGLDV